MRNDRRRARGGGPGPGRLRLTFQSLLLDHGVGSFGHCVMQSLAAHLVQPA